ncbi:hypothetical protein D3C86_1736880 [compost metagenome]
MARRPSVETSRRRVVISNGWRSEIAVTVPCSIPVGTDRRPAAFKAATTASGVRMVAMSMSSMDAPIRALRTQPPTKRAQSAPPASASAAMTARVAGAVSQS